MPRIRSRSLVWLAYYLGALVLALLVLAQARADAHGNGCCLDPCEIYPIAYCPDDTCRHDTNHHFYQEVECLRACRAGICWWYTDNGGVGSPCEFLCANDDWAQCI
jgi:hypothetical protein